MLNNIVAILNGAGGAAGAVNFLGAAYKTGFGARSYACYTDASNNVISVGSESIAAGTIGSILSIASTGTSVNWQRKLTDNYTSNGTIFQGISSDGSNFYGCGYGYYTGGATNAFLAKYNSSGAIQWQRYLYDTNAAGSQNDFGRGVATDSSGNSYFVGSYWNASLGRDGFLAKYDSSGTLSFKNKIADTNTASNQSTGLYAVATDGTSVFTAGQLANATGGQIGYVAKYNSSGTVQWQRTLTDPSGGSNVLLRGVAYDSSGNVYAVGSGYATGSNQVGIIAKYNSSGTIQWQRTLTDPNPTPSTQFYAAATDSSGNLYVAGIGRQSGSTTRIGILAKYNSSGTIQWQKTFSGGTAALNFQNGLQIESGGSNVIASGNYTDALTYLNNFIVRYPTDGSKTGTYTIYSTNAITIATSTWTDASSSWTDAAGTATHASATDLNAGTPAWTDAAASLTYSGVTF